MVEALRGNCRKVIEFREKEEVTVGWHTNTIFVGLVKNNFFLKQKLKNPYITRNLSLNVLNVFI